MIKNYYYLIAGILSILFSATHAWNGQSKFLPVIDSASIEIASKTTIFYIWHIITIENLVFGIAFIVMSASKDLSRVRFAACMKAILMIARWIVIFGSTVLKEKDQVAATLMDSIAIVVLVILVILGIKKKQRLAIRKKIATSGY